ncbi:hypothetical protein Z945_3017 [Sulfitobacter noctilucae]|nr:hypothetical protein Z945_3017 [Sulfitobacter noctilucae]
MLWRQSMPKTYVCEPLGILLRKWLTQPVNEARTAIPPRMAGSVRLLTPDDKGNLA